MMKRTTLLTLLALLISWASFATIVGPSSVCEGSSATYTVSPVPGGTWSSSNTAVASVSGPSSAGYVSGVSPGTAIISYVSTSGTDTKIVTIDPLPAPIVGGGVIVCNPATLSLSDATPGGTWSVYPPSLATISSAGVLTPSSSLGTLTVYYTAGGCNTSTSVTVNAVGIDSIYAFSSVICVGSTTSLYSNTGSGTWSSSNPAVATITGGFWGVVTGVSAGTTIITHTYTNACGAFTDVRTITVTTTAYAGTLSGVSSLAVGSSGYITSTETGGAWSSSNPAVATVVSSVGGYVTGVSPGTATISYSMSGCAGSTAYATHVVSVNIFTGISGQVRYAGGSPVLVWLIKYDPGTSMLTAVDSVFVYSAGDSAYYQFSGLPTDSFRVKAALSTHHAFFPTYHNSSFYWNAANVIYHLAGTIDANKDINLIAGLPLSGSGFIGGSVITGANKGTAEGAPVAGMGVYLLNAATKAVLQYTTTDASGNYSFSGLPIGIYDVFPEQLGYLTTPYLSIALTASNPSMSAAKFMQRTVSKKITPIGTVAVSELEGSGTSVVAFPNPTSGKLNINWDAATTEAATLIITDVTGREILKQDFSMTKGAGAEVVDLSSLTNGMYFISVKSANTMYISKIEVRH